MAELHRKRGREGRSEEGNDGEGGKREEKRGGGETKWKNLRFPARGETVRGEFVSVGVTLDKRRGLYVVLTPRFSTEKQPLSPTWKPLWTSVTTIAEEHTHRWRAERCRLRRIRRIFIFLTLSHHPPHPLIPFSHPRPSIPVWTHFFPHIRFPVGTEPHSSSSSISSFVSFLLPK